MDSATTVSPVMNCGHGDYGYDRNSYYQRECANLQKGKIEEVIKEKLDVKKFSSTSNTIRIADLGCSIGPNTFIAMHNLVEAMKQKFHSQFSPSSKMPEFQVLFNDQPSNDFNTLFTSLPKERPYFPVGVPGSFHGRLFPESSIHFAYASHALHWLSKVPEELLDKKSPAWNKGRVHYTNAPKEVVDAYKRQFFEDMNNFLNAREKEIVTGGMIVIILPSIRREQPHSEIPMGFSSDSIASVLMDMVKEGLVDENEANSFNLPIYFPSPEDIMELTASNSCFSIEMMDTTNPAVIVNNGPLDVGKLAAHYRAGFEGLLTKHFNCGVNFIDDFFGRLTKKFIEGSARLHSTLPNSLQLLSVDGPRVHEPVCKPREKKRWILREMVPLVQRPFEFMENKNMLSNKELEAKREKVKLAPTAIKIDPLPLGTEFDSVLLLCHD